MAFKECVMYKAVCDCCEAEADYEEFWGWANKSDALSYDNRFQTVGEQHLCAECWCWPEALPDYPGDGPWQGGDDPVRKVGCHPEPDVSRTEEAPMPKNRGTDYAETEAVLAALDGDMGDCSTWLDELSALERARLDAALQEVSARLFRLRQLDHPAYVRELHRFQRRERARERTRRDHTGTYRLDPRGGVRCVRQGQPGSVGEAR